MTFTSRVTSRVSDFPRVNNARSRLEKPKAILPPRDIQGPSRHITLRQVTSRHGFHVTSRVTSRVSDFLRVDNVRSRLEKANVPSTRYSNVESCADESGSTAGGGSGRGRTLRPSVKLQKKMKTCTCILGGCQGNFLRVWRCKIRKFCVAGNT